MCDSWVILQWRSSLLWALIPNSPGLIWWPSRDNCSVPHWCLVIHGQGEAIYQAWLCISWGRRRGQPPCTHTVPSAVMLLCLLWPLTRLLKGLPRPRNYSGVRGQRGRVYLAPHGGGSFPGIPIIGNVRKGPKPPDPCRVKLAVENHLHIDPLVETG